MWEDAPGAAPGWGPLRANAILPFSSPAPQSAPLHLASFRRAVSRKSLISSILRGCDTEETGRELQARHRWRGSSPRPRSGHRRPSPRGPPPPGEGSGRGRTHHGCEARGVRPAPAGRTDMSVNRARGPTGTPPLSLPEPPKCWPPCTPSSFLAPLTQAGGPQVSLGRGLPRITSPLVPVYRQRGTYTKWPEAKRVKKRTKLPFPGN